MGLIKCDWIGLERCPYEKSNFGRRCLSRFSGKVVFFEFAKLGRFIIGLNLGLLFGFKVN